MSDKKSVKIVRFLCVELLLLVIVFLVYKCQINDSFAKPITGGLKWAHKPNAEYDLSAENDSIIEEIILDVPKLREIVLSGRAEDVEPAAMIDVTIAGGDADFATSFQVQGSFGKSEDDYKIKLDNPIEAEGPISVSIRLSDPGATKVFLTANSKWGIVTSFNQNPDDKTNVIAGIGYGSVGMLSGLYVVVACLLFLFVGYIFLGLGKKEIYQLFPVCMIILGICFQVIIPIGGVPDESWHVDTAYRYSNVLMGISDDVSSGTIHKRKCDIVLADMLGNDVETNSYYQLSRGMFKDADDTELVEVPFHDTSNQVPAMVFMPMALGMTIGRLLGLSAVTVYVFGRLFAFAVYAALMFVAVSLMPFGKNFLCLLAMLPIALQQGGSASYDSVIIGVGSIFVALTLRSLKDGYAPALWEKILFVITGILLVVCKGGVYVPVVALGLYFYVIRGLLSGLDKKKKLRFCMIGAVAALALLAIFIFIYKDMFGAFMNGGSDAENSRYTVSYFLSNPLTLLKMLWATFFKRTGEYLLQFLGGNLGWLTLELSWIIVLPQLFALILFVNAGEDAMRVKTSEKALSAAASFGSILLVVIAMLLAFTDFGKKTAVGVQGRYFLPFSALMFLPFGGHIFNVSKADVKIIWKVSVFVEAVTVLQILVCAWT
ncbi:DUF2142 domain-containing protein [Butyrivibrio sp. FC2001]|uniref:DUF2142 domain-containing protein n=1 Tax=Butyrivibrio sp. FC2001 TaxID=1280671 RepID=UPI00041D4115|nr:DUF2142 domain-containing protein [Butyrivibrio sp. FC2001]